jgi:hypothetical protein
LKEAEDKGTKDWDPYLENWVNLALRVSLKLLVNVFEVIYFDGLDLLSAV